MNEGLIKLFDEAGVRRSFTVPYVEGQMTHDHVSAVGTAAGQVGGLTNNLVMTTHHSDGKGWGTGDGHTVGYVADKLRSTLIPKDDKNAKAALDAAHSHLNGIESLVGEDDPTIQTAKGQLALAQKTDGAGMNLLDFGVLLTQIMYAPHQLLARAHSQTKDGGHAAHLRAPAGLTAPQNGAVAPGEAQGGESGSEGAQEAQAGPSGAPAAQETPAAATPEASAQG